MSSVYISTLKLLIGITSLSGSLYVVTSTEISTDLCSLFSSKNCSCFKSPKYETYEVQCSARKGNVKIHFIPLEYLHLDCSNKIEYQVNILPNVNIDVNTLKLSDCMLISLKDVLQKFNITNLKRLYLKECILGSRSWSQIDPAFFEEISSVESLNVSTMPQTFAENLFESFPNLKHLYLENSKLTEIGFMFERNPKLNVLDLSTNSLKKLPESVFRNLPKVQQLNLEQNALTKIRQNDFKGLKSLRSLDISSNIIKLIEENTFENCNSLITLEMQNNELKDLPSNLFLPLESLEKLNLERNQISTINHTTFNGLRKLKLLNLKSNKISSIDVVAFSYLLNLVTLDLSYNQWKEESFNVFSDLDKIEELYLSHNHISFLLKDILRCAGNLRELDLSYNSFNAVQVVHLVKISDYNVSIDLSHNNVSFIDFNGADFILKNELNMNEGNNNYVQIDISNNPLICEFINYNLIKYLRGKLNPDIRKSIDITLHDTKCFGPKRLENTPIKDISLEQITSYRECNCSCNCTCFIRHSDDVYVIDCSYRNLDNLPSLSIKHPRVEINLEGNSLKRGPKEREGYENVRNLYLSNNKLISFDWCPPYIERMNLSHNNLKLLGPNVLNTLNTSSKFSQLTLGQNPWICDCLAFELQNFVRAHDGKIDNVLCENDNTALLEKRDLCKSKLILSLQILIPILSFFLVIAIGIALYFIYKIEIKIWLFSKNWCFWFVSEEELDKDKKYDIFLSFSHKDEEFVIQNLLSRLEKTFILCIHTRDWIPGELIKNHIEDSVYNSRRTVVILSNNFLESDWGKLEFLMAHIQSLEEGRQRVIVVKLGNLDMDKMTNDFKAYIKTKRYIEWGEPWFWEKLIYALPHSTKNIANTNQKLLNIIPKSDDKFELDRTPGLLKKWNSDGVCNFEYQVPLIN